MFHQMGLLLLSWREYALVLEIMNIRAEICPKYFFKAVYRGHISKSFFVYMHFSSMFLLALFSRCPEYLNVLEFHSVLISPRYEIHIPSNPPFKRILFSCLQLKTLSTMLLVGRRVSGTKLPLLPEEESHSEESEDCQPLLLLSIYEFMAMVPTVDHTLGLLLT